MSNIYRELKNQMETGFQPMNVDEDLFSSYKLIISDKKYFQLMDSVGNGGFFFASSLHLYGYSKTHDFHNINYINQVLKQEYENIVDGLVAFAQDIFGNQFCFNEQNSKIEFFNIETGDREIIAYDIEDWIGLLFDELDYFTGHKVSEAWRIENQLSFDQRLCPKIPFILGGAYTSDNVYAAAFPKYIEVSAYIAKQVYGLPDGSNFTINIQKKN